MMHFALTSHSKIVVYTSLVILCYSRVQFESTSSSNLLPKPILDINRLITIMCTVMLFG